MIAYDLNDELGILHTKFEGEITVKDLFDKIDFVSGTEEIPNNIKILADFRNGKISFGGEDVKSVAEYALQKATRFNFIKEALVTNESNVTALAMIYQKNVEQFPFYTFKVFSNYDTAIEWLIQD